MSFVFPPSTTTLPITTTIPPSTFPVLPQSSTQQVQGIASATQAPLSAPIPSTIAPITTTPSAPATTTATTALPMVGEQQQQRAEIRDPSTCRVQRGYIPHIFQKTLGHLSDVRPIAIISYGPAGSGKSRVISSVLAQAEFPNPPQPDNFARILVDDFVESIEEFQQFTDIMFPTEQQSPEAYTRAVTSKYDACRREITEFSGTMFRSAIQNRFNILYETTGNNVTWMLGDVRRLREAGYTIVLAYPLVSQKVLFQRLALRERVERRRIDRSWAMVNFINAMKNLIYVAKEVDYVYIFDNTAFLPVGQPMPVIVFMDTRLTNTKTQPVVECDLDLVDTTDPNIEWDISIIEFLNILCMGEPNWLYLFSAFYTFAQQQ